ncbi:MAG: cytochrome b [Erythrobacter sp.]|nr:cytochrome b [Erythrobacter sp.]
MTATDTPLRYGFVSRVLHWSIAALLAWQFGGMALKEIVGRTPLMGFWVGSHSSVGTLLLALIAIRAIWALTQMRHRPPHGPGLLGRLANLGHVALYVLMLTVPSLAFLRMLGGERPVAVFGVTLRGPRAEAVEWMTAPANLLHGTLAWTLLALIAGHVSMALLHGLWWRDGTLARMAGRVSAPRS